VRTGALVKGSLYEVLTRSSCGGLSPRSLGSDQHFIMAPNLLGTLCCVLLKLIFHIKLMEIVCLHCRNLTQVEGIMTASRGRNNRLPGPSVPAAGRQACCCASQRTLHFVHKCGNMTHLCSELLFSNPRLAENHWFCQQVWLSLLLFSFFRQKFSLHLISFTFIRVGVAQPPSSRCIFAFPLLPPSSS
jgi:hypothetical protein